MRRCVLIRRLLVLATMAGGCLFSEPGLPDDLSTGSGSAGTGTSTGDTAGTPTGSGTGGSDGTSGGGPDGVACDMDTCIAPQVCCAAMAGSACAEDCGDGEVPMTCDGPEDCAGGVCCWGLVGGSACASAPGDCEGGTPDVACHDDDDCADAGGTCTEHGFVHWISICG